MPILHFSAVGVDQGARRLVWADIPRYTVKEKTEGAHAVFIPVKHQSRDSIITSIHESAALACCFLLSDRLTCCLRK
jgi:hypothetical protein